MADWKRKAIRFVVYFIILAGISAIWKFIDVATYGESQRSAADAIAAVIMTNCIDTKIWGGTDNG